MPNTIVVGSYNMVPKSELNSDNLAHYRNKFTHRSKFDSNIAIETYYEDQHWFGFPRHAIRLRKDENTIIDERSLGKELKFSGNYNLYDYQRELLQEFSSLVSRGATGLFIVAAPGSGKTVMGIEAIRRLGREALIVVPKSDLVDQWISRFTEHTSLQLSDIAIANNGSITENWASAKIVIGIVHTLALDRFGEAFKRKFGVVLFDEADSSVPPSTFSCVPGLYPAKYRIGMTATRFRSDGLHSVFEEHLGQHFLSCKSNMVMTPKVLQVEFSGQSGYVNQNLDFKFRRGQLITAVSNNTIRTKLICQYITKCYKSDYDVLVLSDRKEQLKNIFEFLTDYFCLPKQDIGYMVRSLDDKQLKKDYKNHVIDNCKIILGTYGMASRGTDIKRLSALVLATPQMNMTQISGRIERFLEGKKTPIIVDIVDVAYKDALTSGQARFKQYLKRNMEVKRVRLNV